MAVRESRDAGIPGSRVELGERGRGGEPPREGMLATAGPDEENAHGGRVYGWRARTASREAPVPTSVTGTSSASATNET